jgi:hypothetical protein
MSNNAAQGDDITLSYDADTGEVEDLDGNPLENFPDVSVVNNVGSSDTVAPAFVSASVENGYPNRLIVTFSEPVIAGDAAGFSVSGLNAGTPTLTLLSGNGTAVITLGMDKSAVYGDGDDITLSYSLGTVTDLAGNALATFTGVQVTNNVNQLKTPTPGVSSAEAKKIAAVQPSVTFTLTNPGDLTGSTWKVYPDENSATEVESVSASNAGATLTLSHSSDIPAGSYYLTATQSGKGESNRLALSVTAYTPPPATAKSLRLTNGVEANGLYVAFALWPSTMDKSEMNETTVEAFGQGQVASGEASAQLLEMDGPRQISDRPWTGSGEYVCQVMFAEILDFESENLVAAGIIELDIDSAETVIEFDDIEFNTMSKYIEPNPGMPNMDAEESTTGLRVTPLMGNDGGFRFQVNRSTLAPNASSFVIEANGRLIMQSVNFDSDNVRTIDYPFVEPNEEYTFKVIFYGAEAQSASQTVTITAPEGKGEIKAGNEGSLTITVDTSQGYVQMNTEPQLPEFFSPFASFEYYIRQNNNSAGRGGDYSPTDKVPLAYLLAERNQYLGLTCSMSLECVVRYGDEVRYEGRIAESSTFTMPSVATTSLSGTITVNNGPSNPEYIQICPAINFEGRIWTIGNYNVSDPGVWSGEVLSAGTHNITSFLIYIRAGEDSRRFTIPIDPPLSVSSAGGTHSGIALTVDYNN